MNWIVPIDGLEHASPGWPSELLVRLSVDGSPIEPADLLDHLSIDTPLDFELVDPAEPTRVRATGASVWPVDGYADPMIGWHLHDPCRHGVHEVNEAQRGGIPEDPDDAGWVTSLLAWRAAVIADVVVAERSMPPKGIAGGSRTVASPEHDAGFALLVRPLLPASTVLDGVEEWSRASGERNVIDRMAEAGWDVAVSRDHRHAPLEVMALHAPGGRTSRARVLAEASDRPCLTGEAASFYVRRSEPGGPIQDDTVDHVTIEELARCTPGAGMARFHGDIAEWEWTSPLVSAPFRGWMSVTGATMAFVSWVADTSSPWSALTYLPDGPWSAPPTMREWLLAHRAQYEVG